MGKDNGCPECGSRRKKHSEEDCEAYEAWLNETEDVSDEQQPAY